MTTAAVESVKNYKGGWKDPGLRSSTARISLSQPLERPSTLNPEVWLWAKEHPATIDADSHVVSKGGSRFYEVCTRCRQYLGIWGLILEDGSKLYEADVTSRPCPCPPEGTTLHDLDPVGIADLDINGIAQSVLLKAGINTTHDAEDLGWRGLENTPGIGPGSVKALREAIRDANLPELRAGDHS